jgi:hypothetical protein
MNLQVGNDQSVTSDYSAFTVAELGDILNSCTLYSYYDMPNVVEGGEWQWGHNGIFGYGKTEADARAEMLIHLSTSAAQATEG